jgi:hypothetical protein
MRFCSARFDLDGAVVILQRLIQDFQPGQQPGAGGKR